MAFDVHPYYHYYQSKLASSQIEANYIIKVESTDPKTGHVCLWNTEAHNCPTSEVGETKHVNTS